MQSIKQNTSSRKLLTWHYDGLEKALDRDLNALKAIPLFSQANHTEINFLSPTGPLQELCEHKAHFYPNAPEEFFLAYAKNCLDSVLIIPMKKSEPALIFKPQHKKLNQCTITLSPKDNNFVKSITAFGFIVFYAGKKTYEIPAAVKKEYSKKAINSLFQDSAPYPAGIFELPITFFKDKNITLEYNGKSLKGPVNDALRQINYKTETRGSKKKIDPQVIISTYKKVCREMKRIPDYIPVKKILNRLSLHPDDRYHLIHENTVRPIIQAYRKKPQ